MPEPDQPELRRLAPESPGERSAIHQGMYLFIISVVLDQATKLLVEGNFDSHDRIVVVPHIFDLVFVTNKGAAWGMFSQFGNLLLFVSLAVFVLMIVFLRNLTEGWTERYYALALILSGIAGNSIDRLFRGEVVDFLDFYWQRYHWPAFNIADTAISIGVVIFILSSLLRPQIKQQEPQTQGSSS